MFNRIAPKVAAIIKRDMEIITSDGRRAGYVADVASGEILSHSPARRIPLDWIRRVDEDVHIAPRLTSSIRAHCAAMQRRADSTKARLPFRWSKREIGKTALFFLLSRPIDTRGIALG